jgi:hypothetical protein
MPEQRRARCRHNLVVCSKCVHVTDAAKRMSDNINGLLMFTPWDARNGWLAIRLIDGGYDGVLYDTRADAIQHQSDEKLCAYFSLKSAMGGTNPRDCQLYLDVHRHAYSVDGGHMAEPAAPQIIVPVTYHDYLSGRFN